MNGDPILNNEAREAKRRWRLPPDAACAVCGIRAHLSLRPDGQIRCYAHRDRSASPATRRYETDHVAGRKNLDGFTAELGANAHRDVTDIRRAMGQDDWPDANGNPLLVVAHALGGIASLLWLIARYIVAHAQSLGGRLGPDWWKSSPPGPFQG